MVVTNEGPPFTAAAALVLSVLAVTGLLYLAVYAYYVGAQDRLPLYQWAILPLGAMAEALAPARLRGLLVVAGAALLSWGHLAAAGPLLAQPQFEGAVDQVAALADRVPESAILVFDSATTGRRLSSALQFVHGRESLILWGGDQSGPGVAALRSCASAQDRSVWYLSSTRHTKTALILAGGAVAEGWLTLDLPEVFPSSVERPGPARRGAVQLALFRLVRRARSPGAPCAAGRRSGRCGSIRVAARRMVLPRD